MAEKTLYWKVDEKTFTDLFLDHCEERKTVSELHQALIEATKHHEDNQRDGLMVLSVSQVKNRVRSWKKKYKMPRFKLRSERPTRKEKAAAERAAILDEFGDRMKALDRKLKKQS